MTTFRFWRLGLMLGGLWLATIWVSSCVYIDSIDQPAQARAGEVITTTVVAHPSVSYFWVGRPYFGIHLPEGWTVQPPLNYTGNYTGSINYDAALSSEMEDILAKPEYYWWVGVGNEHEVYTQNPATGTVHLQTSGQPGFYHLDYMTGDSNGGLNHDLREDILITITANYGAAWRSISSYQYTASEVSTVNIPVTLVDLGEAGFDTFDLSITPPPGWPANFYSNTQISNTGPMTLYQSLPLTVQVTIPPGAELGPASIPITAASTTASNAAASALINITLLSDERGYALTARNVIRVVDPVTHQIVFASSDGLTEHYAYSLAIHPRGEYFYLTFPDEVSIFPGYHVLLMINRVTQNTCFTMLPEGSKLGNIAFTCEGRKALVADQISNTIFFLHTAAPRFPLYAGAIENLPGIVRDMVIGGCGTNLALVTYQNSDTITFINTKQMIITGAVTNFSGLTDIVVAPDGERAYVANEDGLIGIID
ncbi:MAG: hypothetical protein AB1801_14325, partial [Chloroflexota bacterium]